VLIRTIIHEAGLADLDSLRRTVHQHRLDEGWLVTNLWVSQSVKQALNRADHENLTCLTFDELIDQDANFEPYLDWLEREISKREIDRYYVDLGCTKGEFDADTRTLRGTSKYSVADGGIDRYIDRWLKNPVTEHVSILGEFGTGKTWFAFHYAGKCLQAYREAKSKGMPRTRLPLVIPLRDTRDVKNVLAGFFFEKHNIRFTSDVFDRLNQMGKLLLIFDGFDEMADRNDPQKVADHFWELAKVVTPNAKVILTCRTEHFPTAQDGRENFGGERIPSTANKIAVAPKFETLELLKFDDEQIREVLSRRTNLATVELVMANSQLLDLLRRAVMAEFVLEALPEIERGERIDLARVYLYAVRHKMERDITTGRTFTSLADKLYFLCELAGEMLSEDKMTLNYREFPKRLQDLFGKEVESQKHLDHWHYDMMGQTMLIRNDDGDYSPAHRSLLEFFVAYKFAAELGLLADDFLEMAQSQSGIDDSLAPQFYTWSGYWQREVDDKGERKLIAPLAGFERERLDDLRDTFGKSPLTKAILDLLLPALNLDVKYRKPNRLLDLIKSTKAADVEYLGGNAATVLVKINHHALDYQDLSGTNLAHADLLNTGLRKTKLSAANMENCLITRVFGGVNAIVMSRDDRQFITAHSDHTIRIWDRDSGREIQKLTGHQESVECIALSKDGKLLYSGDSNGTIKEWVIADNTCQKTFKSYVNIECLSLSENEQVLYAVDVGGIIYEWKIDEANYYIKSLGEYSTHEMLLNENGKFLYSASNDGRINRWTLDDNTCQLIIETHQESISGLALSADRKFLYSGDRNGIIKQWKLSDGICQKTFQGHQRSVDTISLSRDGKMLYSGSYDGTIKEWQVDDGSCQRTFNGLHHSGKAIILSRDDQMIYSGDDDGTINEWKLDDGSCQRTFQGHQSWVMQTALNQDCQFLYSGSRDDTIKEWRLTDSSCQRTFHSFQDGVMTIALSTDKNLLYSGGVDGTIKEWNLNDGLCHRTFNGYQKSLNTIILSANGKFLYSSSDDGTIKEWELERGTCLQTFCGDEGSCNIIALDVDDKLLYSGGGDRKMDGVINEWRLADGVCQRTFHSNDHCVFEIVVSSDGQWLYSAGLVDCTIKQWRLSDGFCQRTFEGHKIAASNLVLNTEETLLYSSGGDNLIKEWDVTTGECLRSIDTRLCAGANITNVKGLTPAQTDSLIALGAFSDDR
jgi:WD40 repeat protein